MLFGYELKKKSKKQEVIDAILVLSKLLESGSLADPSLISVTNEKIKDLIKEL